MPDHALLTRARDGDGEAFEALYRRHHRAATRAAHSYSSRSQLAEDAVQEAFMRILHATKEGGGPITEFRAYLATTVRHVIAGWTRGERTIATDELETLAGEDLRDTSKPESRLRWHLLTKAFKSLPTRWQEALWLGEVEGISPAELAERWNMSANSAAALSYRAREGLRTAWLDAHVNEGLVPEDCRPYVSDLSRYTQGKLTDRRETQVRGHLDDCEYCRAVLLEVDAAASELRVLLLPVVLWGGLALAGTGLSLGPATWVAKQLGAVGRRGLAFGAASTAAVVVVAVVAMNPGSAEPIGNADDGRSLVVSPVAGGSSGGGTDSASDGDDADEASDPADSPTDSSTTTPGDGAGLPGSSVPAGAGGSATTTTPIDPPSKDPSPTVPAPTAPPVTDPTDPVPTVPPVTDPTDPTEEPEPSEEPPAAPGMTYLVTEAGLIELHGTGEPGATVTVAAADTGTSGGTTGTRSVVPRAPLALPGGEVATTTVAADGTWSVQPDLDVVAGLTVVAIQTINELESALSEPVPLPARPAPPTITGYATTGTTVDLSGAGADPGARVRIVGIGGAPLAQVTADDNGVWGARFALSTEIGGTAAVAIQVGSHGLASTGSAPMTLPNYVPPILNPIPLVPLTLAIESQGDLIVFSGTGEPGASVSLSGEGLQVDSGLVHTDGSWRLETAALPELSGVEVVATQTLGDRTSQSTPQSIPLIDDPEVPVPPAAPTIGGITVAGIGVALGGEAVDGATVELRNPAGESVLETTAVNGDWLFLLTLIPSGVDEVYAVQIVNGVESPASESINVGWLIGIHLEAFESTAG
ncbi:sigma-70 family RNA polymerase sigma factor [Pseudactinotalea terrae]|uniref:sigma-70 family RNA polymerase sigma factor n=1 Tax=Pseudactinotalea terrae TaxID=1743262 RepID=UPI001390C62C|nr:sigma-70 family RNA polymerase sigma factor [Pseudactinotalea terrae]